MTEGGPASSKSTKSGKYGQSWTKKEDKKLKKAVIAQGKHHKANWKVVAKAVGGRTAGACQGRWNTVLDPLVDRSPWTPELDAELLQLVQDPQYNSWSKRAAKLAHGKKSPEGEPLRRSGSDVCDRYKKLMRIRLSRETKDKNKTPAAVAAAANTDTGPSSKSHKTATIEVKWTDAAETPDTEDDMTSTPDQPLQLMALPVLKVTRNQQNRLRRKERRKRKAAEAKAQAMVDKSKSNAKEDTASVHQNHKASTRGFMPRTGAHTKRKREQNQSRNHASHRMKEDGDDDKNRAKGMRFKRKVNQSHPRASKKAKQK